MLGGDAHPVGRRVVAIKAPPGPPFFWITLGRSTTDHRPGDLYSPVQRDCSFDKEGYFSTRFKHTIDADQLGKPLCPYKGELSEPSRIKVLTYYDENS